MAVGLPVRLGASSEIVPLYAARESPALGKTSSVYSLPWLEDTYVYLLSHLDFGWVVYGHFSKKAEQAVRLLEMARPWLVEPFDRNESELDALIAIVFRGLDLGYGTRANLNRGYTVGGAAFPEYLGCPYFLT
jgi:hypothetical protein